MCLSWLRRLFGKKPEPKKRITAEQLHQRVVWAVQQVILEGTVPIDQYEVIDLECKAMSLFVEGNPWALERQDLTRARKLIHKHEWMFKTGRLI